MVVKLRMQRFGRIRKPFYKIVAVDARKARNAAPEQLGNLPASLRRIPFVTEKNSKKSLWRVRFVELAENQARSVCAELWASGLGCIPLPSK